MVAASMAVTGPASASTAPLCAGTEDTLVVCVEPFGSVYYYDCVYLGEPPCDYLIVNGPKITCGGRYASVCAFSVGE
jgi:hypothetical protein